MEEGGGGGGREGLSHKAARERLSTVANQYNPSHMYIRKLRLLHLAFKRGGGGVGGWGGGGVSVQG